MSWDAQTVPFGVLREMVSKTIPFGTGSSRTRLPALQVTDMFAVDRPVPTKFMELGRQGIEPDRSPKSFHLHRHPPFAFCRILPASSSYIRQ